MAGATTSYIREIRFRYYCTVIGGFTSLTPAGRKNGCPYAWCNPRNSTDPSMFARLESSKALALLSAS